MEPLGIEGAWAPHSPAREHGVYPLDPVLGISWPKGVGAALSEGDSNAPSLDEARRIGLLPVYADCKAFAVRQRSR